MPQRKRMTNDPGWEGRSRGGGNGGGRRHYVPKASGNFIVNAGLPRTVLEDGRFTAPHVEKPQGGWTDGMDAGGAAGSLGESVDMVWAAQQAEEDCEEGGRQGHGRGQRKRTREQLEKGCQAGGVDKETLSQSQYCYPQQGAYEPQEQGMLLLEPAHPFHGNEELGLEEAVSGHWLARDGIVDVGMKSVLGADEEFLHVDNKAGSCNDQDSPRRPHVVHNVLAQLPASRVGLDGGAAMMIASQCRRSATTANQHKADRSTAPSAGVVEERPAGVRTWKAEVQAPSTSDHTCNGMTSSGPAGVEDRAMEKVLGDAVGEATGDDEGSAVSQEEAEAQKQVAATLRTWNALWRFWGTEEQRAALGIRRRDLKATRIMRDRGLAINVQRAVGPVPGVRVGDLYMFRQELAVIGMNFQSQGGIDYMPGSAPENRFNQHVATCVVCSGGYEDDVDRGEWFEYTGQGGNNYRGDKKQGQDQELVRGNLALANSSDIGLPVRVVRGSPDPNSHSGTLYSYDGLYAVAKWWEARGESGHLVYKFRLERLPNQVPLSSPQVEFIRTSLPKGANVKDRKGLVMEDLSGKLEPVPICVVNTLDDKDSPVFAPPAFEYSPVVIHPGGSVAGLAPAVGCTCKGGCHDVKKCSCAALNGGHFPYNSAGQLLQAKPAVFECGPACACACFKGSMCINRSAQLGVRFRLEVFKTASKGWGVRSWDTIPSGAFVCEYTGVVMHDEDAEELLGEDEYLFNLDLERGSLARNWGDIADLVSPSSEGTQSRTTVGAANVHASHAGPAPGNAAKLQPHGGTVEVGGVNFALDAAKVGSVARFINHSHSPNLFVQNVFHDHHDKRLPHVMLFAQDNIPPMKELTYDYGYTIDSVQVNGQIKAKACHCGAPGCSKRLY